jgi:hypothetical protein
MTREEMIARTEQLKKLHKRAEKILMKYPGVVGVGMGLKETNNTLTDEASFRVYVTRKKSTADLSPDDQIPPEVLGIKTDVIEMDETTPIVDESEYRPLKGGIQAGNGSGSLGTLGCVAKRTADNAIVVLSNHHVMFAQGKGVGDKLGQPDFSESCCCTCGEIGSIAAGQVGGLVDAAIATVNTSIGTVQEINQIGVIAGTAAAIIGETVRKVGRTTGLTTGTVTDINSPANSTAGSSFTHQVRITPVAGVDKFSNNGDSGSVIVNATNQVVALLWGGNTGPSVANNIGDVLTAMGITIPAGVADIDFVRDTASPVPLPTEREMLLRRVQRTLRQTERGQVVLNVVLEFRFEVMQLLQKQRAVGVTWQRHQGPTFLAALFRSLKEPAYQIPRQIEGVSVQRLLMSMAATLEEHGSARLRAAISRHALAILEAADQHNTVDAILQHLTGNSHPIAAQAQGICPPTAVHS